MTKLVEWLSCAVVFMALWLAVLLEKLPMSVSPQFKQVVFVSPVYLLISFACYSLAVVGYRVATFNDCTEASIELQEQIQQAKEDLNSKGMKLS